MKSTGSAIEVKNVTKRFGAVAAVNDVSFTVNPGELFFLLGPSGCGKTTMLRMLAGLESPDSGTVIINGRDVTDAPAYTRDTPMVFQNYALWPHMSVFDNVAFGLVERHIPRGDITGRVGRALEQVSLGAMAARKPGQLSGGQQQRVVLARALVLNPSVMLLDEPLSNLDAKLRIEMRGELERLHYETSITFIYVTHDQAEALSLADRIAVMDGGMINALGTPASLYHTPPNRFCAAFLGEANMFDATVAQIASGMVTLTTPFGELRAVTPTASVKVGDSLHCCIRPEHLRLQASGDASRITADVTSVSFNGPTVSAHAAAAGGYAFKAQVINTEAAGMSAGTRTSFFVKPDHVVVLAE
ncbi:MAG: ABC transporter ATP-binding protein [Spirochaetes bacterium]|nr:ABC transporter ATP-binding protein [Spirochaetota bacterium]